MEILLTGISLGFLLSFMIGPVFFILIETSITKGIKSALAFDFGVIFADICFISIAYFSSFQLIEKIKDDPALFIFGGGVMTTYGIVSLLKLNRLNKTEIHVEAPSYKQNYLNLIAKGFLLNFINVGVLGFWLAIIITIGPQLDMEPRKLLYFFACVIISYFVTDLIKIMLAKQLRQKLTPSNILKVKKISSFILFICGLLIISKTFIKTDSSFDNSFIQKNIQIKKTE